jgi:hypothetical protein
MLVSVQDETACVQCAHIMHVGEYAWINRWMCVERNCLSKGKHSTTRICPSTPLIVQAAVQISLHMKLTLCQQTLTSTTHIKLGKSRPATTIGVLNVVIPRFAILNTFLNFGVGGAESAITTEDKDTSNGYEFRNEVAADEKKSHKTTHQRRPTRTILNGDSGLKCCTIVAGVLATNGRKTAMSITTTLLDQTSFNNASSVGPCGVSGTGCRGDGDGDGPGDSG